MWPKDQQYFWNNYTVLLSGMKDSIKSENEREGGSFKVGRGNLIVNRCCMRNFSAKNGLGYRSKPSFFSPQYH